MKTIEVKFPEIEGMRVENASVDLKNGLSVVEYVEDAKFKKGDIVYYSDSHGTWICVFDYETMSSRTQYIAMLYSFNKLHFNDYMDVICQRLATNSEKQLLFDALKKEGKYWDAEAMEVKECERVPENIGIYCCDRPTLYDKGDGLYIGFNDNKQNLSTSNGIYTVNLNDANIYSRTRCYLKPISHEDVKVGDTILCGDKECLTNYYKIIESGVVYVSDENDVFVFGDFLGGDKLFKLIPIR